jgi:hypothetical protein
MPAFRPLASTRMLLTHVGVGMGAASFWRGAWYVLDDHLFPENATHSAAASLVLGVVGMGASQGLVARAEALSQKTPKRKLPVAAARFGALYTVAVSCVLVWRGTWVGWDCLYERLHPHPDTKSTDPGHATHSGMLSHVVSVTLLLATGLFASVLAPPAAVSVIRDWSIHSGSRAYSGPAQSVFNKLFPSSSSSSSVQTAGGNGFSPSRAFLSTTSNRLSARGQHPHPSSLLRTEGSRTSKVHRTTYTSSTR